MGTRKRSLYHRHGEGHRAFPFPGTWPIRVLILWLGLWAAGSTLGQTPDYSAGVRKMLELGMPNVRKAQYITIESHSGLWVSRVSGPDLKLTGNAWLFEAKTNGTALVLLDELRVAEMISAKVLEERRKARREALAAKTKSVPNASEQGLTHLETNEAGLSEPDEVSSLRIGEWKEADLKGDLHRVIDYVQKVDGENDYDFRRSAASFFLLAAATQTLGEGN